MAVVAQVTAMLGETVVALAHVAPGQVFRIGTAPGVDLAVAGVVDFPLVTGELVARRPIGLGRWSADADEVKLDAPITLELELLTIVIERVERAPTPVPPPAIDRRPHAFVIASLIVHLLVWGAAIVFAAAPRAKKPRPRTQLRPVLARIEAAPPPPPQRPPQATSPYPARRASASKPSAGPRGHTLHDELINADGTANLAAGFAALGKVVDIDWGAKMAAQTFFDPEDPAGVYKFGTSTQFDPDTRPGFETVKTGRFQTVSTGRAVGEDYHLAGETTVDLALCDSPRCEVSGGLAKEAVQRVVQRQVAAVAGCVGDASLVLDLDIGPDGRVKKVHGHGKVARCAAKVIGQLAFPEADAATHAAFTIGYP